MLARTDPDRIRLECLEEENRQLREEIAQLRGKSLREQARITFDLTEAEAVIFCLLYRLRTVEHGHLVSAVYEDDKLDKIEDEGVCIRSHMKRIRAKTRRHGIDFRTIYSFGFEMGDAAHKAATKKMGEARCR